MKLEVLLVDDDNIVIFLQKRQLKLSGLSYDPVVCQDGKEALDYLDKHADGITTFLILLDINMPVMNGWEFLDALQNRPYKENSIVVIVTSSIEEAARTKAFTYKQVADYIIKPFTQDSCKHLMALPALNKFFEVKEQ